VHRAAGQKVVGSQSRDGKTPLQTHAMLLLSSYLQVQDKIAFHRYFMQFYVILHISVIYILYHTNYQNYRLRMDGEIGLCVH
jgi:ABC-type uncharacterized transport system permease subunit